MAFRLTPIAPVLAGVAVAQVGLGVMTPLIPILLLRQGVETQTIGYVASCYFLGFLVGALVCARIVTRVGHIRAFAVFAASAADAALLMSLVPSVWGWALLRFIIGFNMSGLFLVAESWLNDKADGETRGRTFGAYLLVSWLGSAAGPLSLTVVKASGLMFTAVGMAFATALLPMALTEISNPTLGQRRRFSLVRLFRASPLGVACCVTSGLVNSAFYALIPVYLRRLGYDTDDVASFTSATMVAALLVQYPIGLLSDRLGRRPVTLAALLLALGFAGAMDLFGSQSTALLTGFGCCFAGVMAPIYGLGAGQTNDHIAPDDYVGAAGGLLFVWALGAGPSAAAATMNAIGPSGLFVFLAGTLALVSLFTLARIQLRGPIPRGLQSGFVPAAVAPPGVPELAERPRDGD
jgi:MFS family permease